jgi:hypothetical protein
VNITYIAALIISTLSITFFSNVLHSVSED